MHTTRGGSSVNSNTVSFVEIPVRRQTGEVRDGRAAAGGDERLAEAQPLAVDLDRVWADELTVAEEHIDPRCGRDGHGIEAAAKGPHLPHPGHDGGEVHLGVGLERVAKFLPVPGLVHRPRGAEQRLARRAAEVDAGAARQVAFDHRHGVAGLGGGDGGGQPGRAAADDHESYASFGRGGRQSGGWPWAIC